jgi:cyanoexosortase A
MQLKSLAPATLLQAKFWLLGIALSLIVLHISLTWKLGANLNQLSISILLWGAALSLLWHKRNSLTLESGLTSSFFGILLIVLVLLKSLSLFWYESSLLKVLPLAAALGVGLLATDFTGLKQFWREFVIVFLLVIPGGLLSSAVESLVQLNLLTAKIVAFFLWYCGFEVSRQGVNILLSTGSVEVRGGCSGFQSMFLLFRLAVLYLLMFPTNWVKTLLVPTAAVGIAFAVNVIRVALMALLVAFSNPESFEYWHKGTGSQIFSMIAVIAFGLLCSLLIQQDEPELQGSAEQSDS